MRFPVMLAVAIMATQPLELAMNVNVSNGKVYAGNDKTYLFYKPEVASSCTQVYSCMGLLCGLTTATCAPPTPVLTGQCIGILCGVTYQ